MAASGWASTLRPPLGRGLRTAGAGRRRHVLAEKGAGWRAQGPGPIASLPVLEAKARAGRLPGDASEDPSARPACTLWRPWALGRAAVRPPRRRRGPRRILGLRSARGPSVGPGARWMTCASSSPAPPGTDHDARDRRLSPSRPGAASPARPRRPLATTSTSPAAPRGRGLGPYWRPLVGSGLALLPCLRAPPARPPASGSSEPDQRPLKSPGPPPRPRLPSLPATLVGVPCAPTRERVTPLLLGPVPPAPGA